MARLLLERDAESRALEGELARARAGAGGLVFVDGPAGMGKSSLLAHAADLAGASGFRVLRARCGPLEQAVGWGVTRQLLGPVLLGPEADELAVGAAALARRVLEPDPDLPPLVGDAVHAAVYGLGWLVSGLAEVSPTLLVVDDLHWADLPSLRWLGQLARQLPDLRVVVVGATRTGEQAADPDLLFEVLAMASAPPIRLRPLGTASVQTILRARLPAAGAGFVRACHEVTAGNPFLLHALVDDLLVRGVEPTDAVGARLKDFGPEQVSRGVWQQLARLPSGVSELAVAFAVLGREVPLRYAASLAGLAPAAAARLADALRAAGLLEQEGSSYHFVHPLVVGALYHALPPGDRGLRHARAARLLQRQRADPELVALHLLHTEPFGDAATIDLLRAAARHAFVRGAPESAATFLRRALDEPPQARSLEAELHNELGLALAAYLQPEAPELLREAVALAEDPDQRARIALSGGRALGLAGHFVAAGRVCRRGLEPAGDGTSQLSSRLEAELVANAWLQASTVDEARERLARTAATGPLSPLWHVHAAQAAALDGEPAARARDLLEVALRARVFNEEPDTLVASHAKHLLAACGDLDAARRMASELIDLARSRGWLIALAHGCFLRAIASVPAGRIREAEADARLSFDYKRWASPPAALLWSLFPLVDALVELDAADEAEAALAAAGQQGDPPPGALASPLLLQSRARLRLATGHPEDAYADLRAAADRWQELTCVHPGLAAWRVDAVAALLLLGEPTEARRLAEAHLALAERLGAPGPLGAGLRALARTAPGPEAVTLLERAVGVLAGSPAQLEHVRASVDLGAALRRCGRRRVALGHLRVALDVAARGGMLRLARRCREELRACGARPRRSALSGVESLTPAEHRVCTLAARGRTNREIAQELYVAARTVETHLTSVFRKLHISARSQLPTELVASPDEARLLTAGRKR